MATRRNAAKTAEPKPAPVLSKSTATGHVTKVSGSKVSCSGCRWTFEAPEASDDPKALAQSAAAVHEGRSRRSSD